MAKKKKWEDLILEEVASRFEPTYLGVDQPRVGIEDQPNFKVYGFSPNRKLDGDHRYLLAGPEWQIMLQTSLLKSGHDMLGDRLGFNFTFEDWFEDWRKGFTYGINRTGNITGLVTNYPIRATGGKPGWREDVETRPAYLEWKNPNKKLNKNYRVIEYFPTGKDGESVVFTGSDRDIIQQILVWTWQTGGGTVEREPGESVFTTFRGLPKVNLWFAQAQSDKDPNYQLVRGQIGFRIMGKTERHDLVDQGKTPYSKLTAAEIEQLANRIITHFAQPQPHVWYKGKLTYSYRDKPNGIETWGYVTSKTEGVQLLTKLLAVAEVTLDRTKLKYSETDDADGAYPTVPPDMKVLGQTLKGIRKRPYTPVYFTGATLSVESLTTDIRLTDDKIVIFEPQKFAETTRSLSWL